MAGKALNGLVVLFLFSPLAYSQTTPRQTGQYDIRGNLVFNSPKPPEDRIQVHLERNMQRILSVFTDAAGNFEFRSVPPGDYFIIVHLPDYEEVAQSVTVYTMQRATSIAIQMNPLFRVTRTRASTGFEGDDPDVIDVKMAVKKYPKKAVQAYEKALDESKKGDAGKAVAFLEEAVKIAPDFYHAQNNLGVNYLKTQRYREAEKAYRAALELNPKAQQPLLNLGILFITESDVRRAEGPAVFGKLLDTALDFLDAAIKIKPRSAVAHYYLGTAFYKSEFYDEAEASLKKAQEYDPAMGNIRLMLINVYIKQKRLGDAVQQIDAFIRDNPKAPERAPMEELRAKIAKSIEPSQE